MGGPATAGPATRLVLAYDGAGFAGWARQPGRRTVQGEVERALAVLLRGHAALTVAGRTDRGVHALAQVASYHGPPVAARALDALTPPDISVVRCERAATGFDARGDATSRAYRYRVLASPVRDPLSRATSLWWPRQLDRGALEACAAALEGEHDFTAFTPARTEHVRMRRVVRTARWRMRGERLAFEVEADAFVRHMNRVLVGTMLEAAGARRSVESFCTLLEGRPRSDAGPTAPPHGLALVGVGYGGRPVLDPRMAAGGGDYHRERACASC